MLMVTLSDGSTCRPHGHAGPSHFGRFVGCVARQILRWGGGTSVGWVTSRMVCWVGQFVGGVVGGGPFGVAGT
jgi:hypothetical protein